MIFDATPMELLFLLLCGHAIADFALQNEWIATNKNRHVRKRFSAKELAGMETIWPWLMGSHALSHGLFVYLFTGSLTLGVAETLVHFLTDSGKCEGWYGFHVDQTLHVLAKVLWVGLLTYGVV